MRNSLEIIDYMKQKTQQPQMAEVGVWKEQVAAPASQ
jgi:hypothetical protein